MRRPPRLSPGDRIAIVAPASPFPREDFDIGVARLRARGYDVVWSETVFARRQYLAGDAPTRAADLMTAWSDPRVKAIIAARGGFGSAQLFPWLDFDLIRSTPKIFVGCSDLTSFLAALTGHCDIVGFHGPMMAGQYSRGDAGSDDASWDRALCGTALPWVAGPDTLEVFSRGEAIGTLVGGNLTQLAASLGTTYAFSPPIGSILFLEDVGERPYRLDRLLTQLRQAGILACASALVFGQMLNCDEPGGTIRAIDVVRDVVRDFPGPVVYGLPAGHTSGPAVTLPLGVRAFLRADKAGCLTILDSAVE